VWISPAFRLIGIGWYLAAAIIVPTLIGRWLDGRFDSEPVWTLVLLVLGLVAGFYGAYTQLREFLRVQEARARRGGSR
jgi:F0F1-type ATP synthase assembly protein I